MDNLITPAETTHHVYFYDPKVLDYAKITQEAMDRLSDKRNGPTKTIVHHHSVGVECLLGSNQNEQAHDLYIPEKKA